MTTRTANQDSVVLDGEKALVEVATRLFAIEQSAIVRPGTDPHSAAVTAMLVADYLQQPEVRDKLASVDLTLDKVQDLGKLARALLAVVVRLDGDYLPDDRPIPADMLSKGQEVRATVSAALEKAKGGDADVALWLEAIRLGSGVVDLVYDLRTLGELCARHLPTAASATASSGAVNAARVAAHALEMALRDGEDPEDTKRRDTIARLWTLFLPLYDAAAKAGRALGRDEGKEQNFPPLALVASHRRARRRPFSLVPPASLTGDRPSEGRRQKRQTVEIEVGIASESNLYLGFTENLSEGGVFVATYTRKPIGSTVEIALTFPNGDVVNVPGVVRWLREGAADTWPGMGVQFEALSPDDERKLQKFLSLREPMFYDD